MTVARDAKLSYLLSLAILGRNNADNRQYTYRYKEMVSEWESLGGDIGTKHA